MTLEQNCLRVLQSANTLGNQSMIALPNCDHHHGLNDKFSIMHWKDCEKYRSRLTCQGMKVFCFVTSEIYLKHVISTTFDDVVEIPFRFTII